MPSSPYCMIYLWWKAKEKIMADHSWEWKSIRKLVDVIFCHKFRKTYQTGRKQVNARLKLRFWAESIVHKSTHASCKSRLSWLVWPSDQRLWRYVIMSFSFPQQVHRRVLPSHTVYAANLERLLSRMWHPGHDEIEQNQLHNHEAKRRYERLKQQRSLRMWPLCVATVRKTGAKRRYERLFKATTESENVTFVCSHCS